jgi:hypothetical protein
MDLSRLKEIHDQQAQETKEQLQRNEDALANIGLQETVVKSFSTLVNYLDNKVTKTIVVNQLKDIGTPDALKVVEAVESLHSTLKTHENTDLTEITSVMKELLDEAKKIPKEKVEIPEHEEKDYVAQFTDLTDAVRAVEQVVKEQNLVVEAPIVNVPETQVNVDAPDLKPLQTSIKDVVTAIKKIVIPVTDNTQIENYLAKQEKLLKKILDKPVGGGGGGGGSSWVAVDENGIPLPLQLQDGAVETVSPALATRIDDSADPVLYIGKAPIGSATSSAVWQVVKLDTTSGLVKTWASSSASFDKVWDDRASLNYS